MHRLLDKISENKGFFEKQFQNLHTNLLNAHKSTKQKKQPISTTGCFLFETKK